MKKLKKIAILVSLLFFTSTKGISQLRSQLNQNGINFPTVNLQSTLDTTGLSNPVVGQILYNLNSQIVGIGADGAGFYSWQNDIWKKINSTMPSGTIVLSTTLINQNLQQKGFFYLNSISINQNPVETFYLFIKK